MLATLAVLALLALIVGLGLDVARCASGNCRHTRDRATAAARIRRDDR